MKTIIATEKEYIKGLKRFNEIFDADEDTPEYNESYNLSTALIKYETDFILERTIKEVIVTYHDKKGWWIFKRHTKRSFSPLEWEHFGERIKNMAKDVEIIMN